MIRKTVFTLLWLIVPFIVSANIETDPAATVQLTERSKNNNALRARNSGVETAPMVVEGRTWWYTTRTSSFFPGRLCMAEYGVTIGPEVEIDGVKWHELRVPIEAERTRATDAEGGELLDWVYDRSNRCVSYIREENGGIFVKYGQEALSLYEPIAYESKLSPLKNYNDDNQGILLYNNGNTGEEFMAGGSLQVRIGKQGELQSVGNTYRTFELDMRLGSEEWWRYAGEPRWVEGIGCINTSPEWLACSGELLFLPFTGYCAATGALFPTLTRYVTDADGNIIYEGIGGDKLWEGLDGINSVVQDNVDMNSTRWFTPMGREIDRPDASGIYIKVCGGKATKVRIK